MRSTEVTQDTILTPGRGYVFLDMIRPDIRTKKEERAAAQDAKNAPKVVLFSGHVMLENGERVRVEMKGETRSGHYSVTVRQFPTEAGEKQPGDWQKIGDGTMPFFGESNYVDGTIKVRGRTYQVRCIKRQRNGLAFNLPQVLKGRTSNDAAL